MIEKIIAIVMFAYAIIILPYTIFSLDNNLEASFFIKKIMQELIAALFKYGIDGKLYINIGNDTPSPINNNKVDVIIANHYTGSIDIMIIINILHHYNIYTYNFIYNKNNVNYIPGLGLVLKSSYDINVHDYKNIAKIIKKINVCNSKQFMIIFPEGSITNYSSCIENNIHIYNNLLVPRIKGLYVLLNELNKQDKLGSIWNFTLTNNQDNYYAHIRKLYLNNFNNYNILKKNIYNIWKDKDNILENNHKIKYKQIYLRNNYYYFILTIFIICMQTMILFKLRYFILFLMHIIYHYIY